MNERATVSVLFPCGTAHKIAEDDFAMANRYRKKLVQIDFDIGYMHSTHTHSDSECRKCKT